MRILAVIGASACERSRIDFKQVMLRAPEFVLVVDDEKVIADTLVTIFKRHDYAAVACYSAEDAITILTGTRPDYLLADVILPGLNGFELAAIARKLVPTCRVLLMSGHQRTDELLTSANGHDIGRQVIAKPVHPETLLSIFRGEITFGEEPPEQDTGPVEGPVC